ncbi:MAG: hypothetical protein ACXWEY_16010 [Bacteroidia bacterium]
MKLYNLIFIFLSFTCYSQKIEWTTDTKLTPSDFKGSVPNIISEEAAGSMLSIEYKILSKSIWTGNIKIKVIPTFDTEESWIKPEYISESLMNHEQRHFEILKFYSEKLQKIVNKEIKGIVDYNKKFQEIYDKNYAEYMKFQTKFDAETDHGANIEMQNKYDKIIEEMLNSCNCN